jgi:hypothetical protein
MKKILLVTLILFLSAPLFAQSSWDNIISEKDKLEADLKIYPNPCKNSKVTVDFNNNEISEIRFTNITGKLVLLKTYEFTESKVQVELSTIPNGIYLIQVKTSDQKKVVKKLLVSKN